MGILNKLKSFSKLEDVKTQTVARNVFISFFIKVITILVSFLTIPLVLSFLSTTQYGIWLTLTAILNWFSLFDLGFGNGLRNRLTKSLASKEYAEGKIYVSTTYAALTAIFGLVLIIFIIVNPFVNWCTVFNAPLSMKEDLQQAVTYATSLLLVQLVMRLINTVLLSNQRAAMANFTNALVQIFILIGLYILKTLHYTSLTSVSVVYSVMPVVVFLGLSIFYFTTTYKHISPSISFIKVQHIKGLLNIGLSFFNLCI